MLKLLDIGSENDDPRRTIQVLDTDRDQVIFRTAVLQRETDYIREWSFYAFDGYRKMRSELVCDPVHGTTTRFFIEE